MINKYSFFNMATEFLISRRIGLPYPEETAWEEWPKVAFTMVPGEGRARLPLIRKAFNTRCTQIYQPMFTQQEFRSLLPVAYDNEYVRDIASDHDEGVGKVQICRGRQVFEYPTVALTEWHPEHVWVDEELIALVTRQTLEFQLYLMDIGPKHKGLESDRASIAKQQYQLCRRLTSAILKEISAS